MYMINSQLVNPKSIVVVGGSNDIEKPGGKVLKNLIDGNFSGDLYVVNLKEAYVQEIKAFASVSELPQPIIKIQKPLLFCQPDLAKKVRRVQKLSIK